MALWDKVRTELDRAGRAAQGALDEGKLRLEIFRARQLVDRAAQSLGFAVYRDRTGRESLDETTLARLTNAVRDREQEVLALEDRMREATGRPAPPREPSPDDGGSSKDAPTSQAAAAGAAAAGAAAADAAAAESAPAESAPSERPTTGHEPPPSPPSGPSPAHSPPAHSPFDPRSEMGESATPGHGDGARPSAT